MTKQISQKKIKDYPVITLNVTDIKKDPTNPNNMTLEQINGLEKSIVNFGRLKYIVVDQDNILIDGEHRLEVEKANGTTQVQVIQVPVKNEIERKMMRETLNQLHGEYDKQKQSSELLAIFENQRLDELAELLGKPREEFENLITRYNPEISFVKEEDESKLPSIFDTESFVKRGEVWQLGRHRLMCGDSTYRDNMSYLMQDDKANMVFADPPYNINVDYTTYNDNINKDVYLENINSVIKNILKFCDNYSTSFYFWSSNKDIGNIKDIFERNNIKFHQWLFWIKENFGMIGNTDYQNNYEALTYGYYGKHKFYHNGVTHLAAQIFTQDNSKLLKKSDHHARKPIKLCNEFIKCSSLDNDVVLDPFLGSGSTLIACEQTNRICYGMEIDEHYCSVIIRRWEEYTNKKAVKLESKSNRGE